MHQKICYFLTPLSYKSMHCISFLIGQSNYSFPINLESTFTWSCGNGGIITQGNLAQLNAFREPVACTSFPAESPLEFTSLYLSLCQLMLSSVLKKLCKFPYFSLCFCLCILVIPYQLYFYILCIVKAFNTLLAEFQFVSCQ